MSATTVVVAVAHEKNKANAKGMDNDDVVVAGDDHHEKLSSPLNRSRPSYSFFYKLNFFVFLILFFLLRIIGIYPLIMSVGWMKNLQSSERDFVHIIQNHLPLKCVAGTVLLYLLNVGWFLQNLRTAGKIFFGNRKSVGEEFIKQKKSKMN